MAFSIFAFSESQDPAGAYTGISAVTDQIAHTEGDNLYVPNENLLVGEFGLFGASSPGSPYLISPSIREFGKLYLSPVIPLALPTGGGYGSEIPHTPISLAKGEGVQAYDNSSPGVSELHTLCVFLADKPITPVSKPYITVKATANATCGEGSWGSGALTFSDTLPVGRYAIIGGRCIGANVVAFRFVLNSASNRPGGIAQSEDTFDLISAQRRGGLGVWGEFHSLTPPSLEILGNVISGTQTILMDVVYLGS